MNEFVREAAKRNGIISEEKKTGKKKTYVNINEIKEGKDISKTAGNYE